MKLVKNWWILATVLVLTLAITLGATTILANNDVPVAQEPFYGVSPTLTAKLEQIARADSRISSLIAENTYDLSLGTYEIKSNNYNLAVGVRLKKDITPEEFSTWLKDGREDSNIIRQYVGVLNIGYNDRYEFQIDVAKNSIVSFVSEKGYRNIPEITTAERLQALEIALRDSTVQKLIDGKNVQVAPENKIGVWHSGDMKLGIVLEIDFDKSYTIDCELPRYQSAPLVFSGEADGIIINVDLTNNEVASIAPVSAPK